jgi:hypothetical protein
VDKCKFPGSEVYNRDETGVSTVQTPSKILGPKGQEQVGSLTTWERDKTLLFA